MPAEAPTRSICWTVSACCSTCVSVSRSYGPITTRRWRIWNGVAGTAVPREDLIMTRRAAGLLVSVALVTSAGAMGVRNAFDWAAVGRMLGRGGGAETVRSDVDSGQDQRYTCSMHPQVVQHEPGSCPLCRMDLVPLEAPAPRVDTGHDHDQTSSTPAACIRRWCSTSREAVRSAGWISCRSRPRRPVRPRPTRPATPAATGTIPAST